jgi:hypothetical protein
LYTFNSVVTQFSRNKIQQFFVQDGKKHDMPNSSIEGVTGNAVTPDFCTAQFKAFGDRDRFSETGGWASMNSALSGKWVLVMSLWDDVCLHILILSSWIRRLIFIYSITPICFGSIQPIPQKRRVSPAPREVTAHKTLVCQRMLKRTTEA